jgi:hypothetical protein
VLGRFVRLDARDNRVPAGALEAGARRQFVRAGVVPPAGGALLLLPSKPPGTDGRLCMLRAREPTLHPRQAATPGAGGSATHRGVDSAPAACARDGDVVQTLRCGAEPCAQSTAEGPLAGRSGYTRELRRLEPACQHTPASTGRRRQQHSADRDDDDDADDAAAAHLAFHAGAHQCGLQAAVPWRTLCLCSRRTYGGAGAHARRHGARRRIVLSAWTTSHVPDPAVTW